MWNLFKKKEGNYDENIGLVEVPEEKIADEIIEITETVEVKEMFVPIEDRRTLYLKKIARGILLALLVLTPIFFLPFTIPNDILMVSKQLLLFVGVFLNVVMWVVIVTRQGGVIVKRSGFEIGVLAVLTSLLISSVFSVQVYRSFISPIGFISWAVFAVFFFLFVNFFEKKDIFRLSNYFLLGVFIALLTGLLNLFGVPMFKWLITSATVNNQFNTVGSVNSLGALAVLSTIFILSRYFIASSEHFESNLYAKIWTTMKLGIIVLSTILLLILNWWAFYVVLGVGALMIAIAPGIIEKIFGRKLPLKAVNLMIPMIILILSLLLIFGGKYIKFPGQSKITPEVTLSHQVSYQILKEALNRQPVFGYGSDNYSIVFDQFRPRTLNASAFWDQRFSSGASELFNLATYGGAVMIISFLVLLYYLFVSSNRTIKKHSLDNQDGEKLWSIMPVFIPIIVFFGLYGFNVSLYFVFWFLIALMAISVRQGQNDLKIALNNSSLSAVLSSLGIVVVLAAGIIGGYMLVQRYSSEVKFARATRLDIDKQENLDKAISILDTANIGSEDIKYLEGYSQVLLKKINFEITSKVPRTAESTQKLQELVKSSINTAKLMTEKFGNDPASWMSSAVIYQNLSQVLNGADDAAINAFNQYIDRTPNSPSGHLELGIIQFTRAERNMAALADANNRNLAVKNETEVKNKIVEDYNNAETAFKKVAELKPDLAQSYYYLGIIYERQNKLGEAIKQLEILVNGQPNNTTLIFELGLLYYRNGQKDKAMTAMTTAVDLFKDYSNARWYLALMYEEQGKINEAIAQLNEILRLEVNKDNQTVINKIASLEAGQREIPPAKVTSRKPL